MDLIVTAFRNEFSVLLLLQMNTTSDRRKCVIDLLTFLEMCSAAFTNTLGLPAFNIVSASWTYGINIENAILRFRNANPAFAHGAVDMTIDELVHFLLLPESYGRYSEWVRKVKHMIVNGKISGTMNAAAIVDALEGAIQCLVHTCSSNNNPNVYKKQLREFEKLQKSKSNNKSSKITKDSKLSEIAVELADRFGIKTGIDDLSTMANLFMGSSASKTKTSKVSTVSSVSNLITSVKRKLARAAAGRNVNEDEQIISSIAIVKDLATAKPFLDVENRFVIVLDDMTLRLGSAPSVKVDATDALIKLSVVLQTIATKLHTDKYVKEAVVKVLDAFIKVFDAKVQKEQKEKNAIVIARLDAYASSAASAASAPLIKMGLAKATTRSLFGGYTGYATPPPPPPPGGATTPYPYPPGQPDPYGPYPRNQGPYENQQQHVYMHEDPYMKTVAGLSVGAQCCSCCAMWSLADSIGNIGNVGNVGGE